MPEAQFPAEGRAGVSVSGWPVLICRDGDEWRALLNRCSHAASPLTEGRLRHGAIMCPLHGARFRLTDGACIGGAHRALRTFPLRVIDGWIEIATPAAPPGPDERPLAG